MKKYVLLCLLLTSCASMHNPDLAETPQDQAQYEQDLKYCKNEASNRWDAAQVPDDAGDVLMGGVFGALGGAVAGATKKSDNPDYYKNVMEMTDECLTAKGYKIR